MPPYLRVVVWSACSKAPKTEPSLSGSDAAAGVAHGEADTARVLGVAADNQLDKAVFGEFQSALLTRLPSTCPAAPDRRHRRRPVRARTAPQDRGPLACARSWKSAQRRLDRFDGIDRERLDLQLARLDLREIEDVVDDGEQALAGAGDDFRLPLARAAARSLAASRSAIDQHAIHRRADFMAHRGEKIRFGAIGLFRAILGGAESSVRSATSRSR